MSELARLHRAVFGGPPSVRFAARFEAASTLLESNYPQEELGLYRKALGTEADLEAMELAGRLTRRLTVLSKKIELLVYIVETAPESSPWMVNEERAVLRAWLEIGWGGLRSICKAVYGYYLLRRYGLWKKLS